MKIFVTGGAGYVGSFATKKLKEEGHDVVIFDHLGQGHPEVAELLGVPLIEGDLRNKEEVAQALDSSFDAVMHFAAFTAVGPSMKDPQEYFENNIGGGLNLLSATLSVDIDKFIFSSSSEVYGEAETLPLTEGMPLQATNPYGATKVMFEKILRWYARAYNFRYIALRYFNAAGAALDGSMGEDHDPETHLVPAAILGEMGKREFKLTCATDLDTPDGTPIRDYTHVLDIADAHVRASDYLEEGGQSDAFNVGKGSGSTVLEIVQEVERVSGKELPREKGEQREGEPSAKWASTEKINEVLGWQAKYGTKEIVESAWKWHSTHPSGYS
ncbi:MAG: UDP-glucose 4-epimerase GalE [Patescibacteria group bacterium]|nr:UDP-glucose 4-epimerase GalE [Patescibacteria group bacterium]